MRLSKITGIAVAVAFVTGLATTGTAFALTNGTQIEYKGTSPSQGVDAMRSFVIELVLGNFLVTGL